MSTEFSIIHPVWLRLTHWLNVVAVVILVMGVAGAGKTTIGRRLADELGWQFSDGDDFHPAANARSRVEVPPSRKTTNGNGSGAPTERC